MLHVPDAPTKKLQRKINRRLLSALEPHPAALGFWRGASIADQVARHSGHEATLTAEQLAGWAAYEWMVAAAYAKRPAEWPGAARSGLERR